ncbi:PstS family phosphate ABC transporter substrate-binding protein [Fischerella thermalis]|uniref:PstS family phosphate ABC transporter substrate-binding protein n=1 Tax=Fischerella thermalis TaxID=372787 RepID=UPI00307D77BD
MDTQESNHQGNVVCGWCSYDANPLGAKYCQKCGKPLVIASVPPSQPINNIKLAFSASWLPIFLILLLVSGISFLFWNQVRFLSIVSGLNGSSGKISPDLQSISSRSDIGLYNSMKEVPKVPDGIFNYGGAVLFASLTASGTHEAMTASHPNFRLRYTEPKDGKPGTSKGITMLIDGELSIAQIGIPLRDSDYSRAKDRGFTIEQIPIAIDGVVFYTHPDINIPGLSIDQLQAIYKGEITNWKELGGDDVPIVPFVMDPKVANLLNVLLGSEVNKVSPKVQSFRDYTEAIRKVAATPGGISFGGAGPIVGQKSIRPLAVAAVNGKNYVSPFVEDGTRVNASAFRDGTYPFTRRLFIAIRRDGTPDETAGIAYVNMLLSKEGQKFVEKAGYVPLR